MWLVSDVALAVWSRPAATAPIRPLACKPPYAVGLAIKSKNKKKRKKERKRKKPEKLHFTIHFEM